MLTPEIIDDLQGAIVRHLRLGRQYAIEQAYIETSMLAVNSLLEVGISLSSLVEAIANVADERGLSAAVISLERASEQLQQDEPPH